MWNPFKKQAVTAPSNPRELYRQDLQERIDMADAVFIFLRIARSRGFPVKMHFEVDGQMTPVWMEFAGEPEGLMDYIMQAACGVKLKSEAKLDELLKQWYRVGPYLADLNIRDNPDAIKHIGGLTAELLSKHPPP
jgi:hypothetical protein